MPYKYNPFTGTFDDTTPGTVSAAASGTAAAPGISFSGDTNTGIYSPGADQLAISTGGTGRLFVDASGRLGVGISAPTAPTHIVATGGSTNSINVGLIVDYEATAAEQTGAGTAILFRGKSGGGNVANYNQAQIATNNVGGNNEHGLSFFYKPSGASALTEGFRLSSAGNVGIGLTPTYQLQLSTDSAAKPSTALWTITSDERIKEDIELADLDLCYEAVKAIPLKRYKWRDEIYSDEQVTDRRKLGWIAQDVETVYPKAVSVHEFKYNQVYEENIVPAIEEEVDAEGNVITPAQPERTERGELISEDIISDCRDLNADQIYAAMYGAIQKLMAKVEVLEIEVLQLQSQ